MSIRLVVVCGLLFGCGHANPPPPAQTPPVQASATPQPAAPSDVPSVVAFDDLGLSFVVPPGFHVMGDDELSTHVRAHANPHLQADLVKHASEKKGIPLLVLSKDLGDGGTLYVTLLATMVPADATASELMTQQVTAMSENLESFQTTSGPTAVTLDGVAGMVAGTRHGHVAGDVRLYVRNGLAVQLAAVWPQKNDAKELAGRVLGGLHFH